MIYKKKKFPQRKTESNFIFINKFIFKVKEARAVILAGGTMEPMSEFKDQLFISAGANPNRIFTFSCDHVVPKENILSTIISSGPTGVEFEFNFYNRQNSNMVIR